MRSLLGTGLSASEAARGALADAPPSAASGDEAGPFAQRLRDALEAYDEGAANAVLDEAVASLSVESLAATVALPTLEEIGMRWSRGEVTVAQEHFASNLLRGRLLGLARGWGGGVGPLALLACPPGELHDLGLISFGLALRAHGWRITFLGPDTPVETIAEAAAKLAPSLIVLAGLEPAKFNSAAEAISRLAVKYPVALGGAGAGSSWPRGWGRSSFRRTRSGPRRRSRLGRPWPRALGGYQSAGRQRSQEFALPRRPSTWRLSSCLSAPIPRGRRGAPGVLPGPNRSR